MAATPAVDEQVWAREVGLLFSADKPAALRVFRKRDAARLPTVAMVGRSNVGKSSLLNVLLNRKGLARVSQRPGRTDRCLFFGVGAPSAEREHRLMAVDLPGYGYAQRSFAEQGRWDKLVQCYFAERPADIPHVVCWLLDARRILERVETGEYGHWIDALPQSDQDAYVVLQHHRCRILPILTKSDAVPRANLAQGEWAAAVAKPHSGLGTSPILVSARKRVGIDAMRAGVIGALFGAPTESLTK